MPRPMLDRLAELEAALTHDRWHHFAKDVREAIDELRRYQGLLHTVDVNIAKVRDIVAR